MSNHRPAERLIEDPKPSLHERVAVVGWLRRALRRRLFAFFDRLLQSADARALLAERLQGLFDPTPRITAELFDRPYPNLSVAAEGHSPASGLKPVFITARFRSGSTLLWNLFRHIPGITAYYEPLNEGRWFHPSSWGGVDRTHRGVSNYWKEYEALEILGRYHQHHWTDRNLYMGPAFWDPDLKRYLEIMIREAPGRPVLQFNRVDFRLTWLRHYFPTARIIHLYRHPRDQWISSLAGSHVPPTASMTDFAEHDHFYLLAWARDLRIHFPFLNESHIDHPYALFYFIWKLSYAYGRHFGNYSLAYEDLLASPRQELARLFAFLQIKCLDWEKLLSLIEKNPPDQWRRYADDSWFQRHELACDVVLTDFFKTETTNKRQFPVHPPPPSATR
jgi:hypothetical protein